MKLLPRQKIPTIIRPLDGVTPSFSDGKSYFSHIDSAALRAGCQQGPASRLVLPGDRNITLHRQPCGLAASGHRFRIRRRPADHDSLPTLGVRFVRWSICQTPVCGLRWSPNDDEGEFRQAPISLHRLSGFESVLRRTGRVWFDIWRTRRFAFRRAVRCLALVRAYTTDGCLPAKRRAETKADIRLRPS